MGSEHRGYSQRREVDVPVTLDTITNFYPNEHSSPLTEEDVDSITNPNENRFARLVLRLIDVFDGTAVVYYEPGIVISPVSNEGTIPDFLLLVHGIPYFYEVGSKIKKANSKKIGRKKTRAKQSKKLDIMWV